MKTAAGKSGGKRLRICFNGWVAPAEPPITMMSRLLMEPVFDLIVSDQGGVRFMFLGGRSEG
ncbi:hypothetical protein P0R31_28630 [Bradyrhizobium yuanmingense]|uniref:hypothetical protein n=1 Tax=Bradyrhizobium yuanmingense TaxID=108015 RepID=UPI0023B9D58E|nr:hypothetical protein [Bradyrhizobium yuanmingense]MDF0521216.1 hypothetical protein [Bradyrhizobium yuanmingense]